MGLVPRDAATDSWRANLVARLLTAAVVVPVLLFLLYRAPHWGFLALCFVAVVIAAAELFSMTLSDVRRQRAWSVAATFGFMAAILYAPTVEVLVGAVLGVVGGGLLSGLLAPSPPERAGLRIAWSIAGPLYLGALVATLPMLHRLEHGGSWVVLSMTLAWFGDTGAYFFGRFFGKRKLYEEVSPKKTIEGSVGGLLGSLIGVLAAHFWYLPTLPLLDGLLLALVAGSLGQAGDLCESLIKRSVGSKDSGRILPGHGGLLDRVDALLFTSAATWIYATWFL